jgi:uncharacterized protein YndB with AHSA1/START domain
MKWAVLAVAVLVLLVLGVILIGLLLPTDHQATRQVGIRAKPEAVFAIIADFVGGAGWRTGIARVELLPPRDGRTVFREQGNNGEMTYRVEEQTPPRRLVTRIVDRSAFGGTWTYELFPEGEGTRVEITERGQVYNPVFRFMSRFFFSPTVTMERYLKDLQRKVEGG